MARQVNYLNPLLGMSRLYNPYLYNVPNSQLFRGMPTGLPSKRTPGQLGLRQAPVIPSIPRAGYVGPGRSYQAPLSPSGNIMPPTIDARPQTDLSTLASFDNTGRRSIGGKYADFVGQVGSLGNPSAKFAKTMAPFMQGGQAGAINQFVQNPKLGTAASAGVSYALNANPYYAAVNTLTGGALDKGVNRLFNRRKRGQNVAQANEQANIANRMNQYGNEYMRMYGEQQASRREAEQNINEYRNQARNLSMFGPSARETAGLVASAMAPAQQAAAAAQANLAARGAEAGLSPTSGVQMGGQVALQQGLAQAAGQVGTQISQDMQRRAFGMQDTLAGMDAQQRNLATQTALQSLGAASELPMALERLRMAQQQADYARDEQMYQRRFGEQQMLAMGLGAFAPELFDLFKGNRGQEDADTGMIEDAGMLPESDFGQVGGRATYRDAQGILRYFDATDEDRRTGRDLVNPTPSFNFGGQQIYQMPDGKFYDLSGNIANINRLTSPTGQTLYQGPNGNIYDSGGNVTYNPTDIYQSQFTRSVSRSTQIALEMLNPDAREGEYAMNKPPQLANQEFRFVNGRWMKM